MASLNSGKEKVSSSGKLKHVGRVDYSIKLDLCFWKGQSHSYL